MKRFGILAGAAYLCLAQTVSAQHVIGPGLDLTWGECVNEPSSQNQDFNCTTSQTYKLHACVKSPIDISGLIAVDCRLDLVAQNAGPLMPFWHYESGGCNQTGLVLSNDITQSGGCASESAPWGDHGTDALAFVTAYVPGFNGATNSARIFVSIARSALNPTTLTAGTNYYLFHFDFRTANHAACAGCDQKILIVWDDAILYNNEGRDPEVLLGPDKSSICATINRASVNACGAVETRNTTWGQLKSMYR